MVARQFCVAPDYPVSRLIQIQRIRAQSLFIHQLH